jgi:magnesium chelatase family protein
VEVTPVPFRELSKIKLSEKSDTVRERVIKARHIQEERFKEQKDVYSNSQMSTKQMREYCLLPAAGDSLIKTAMEKLGLSARAYDRILKVSRTIADLDSSEDIRVEHLAEAIQYRSLDKENWAG